MTNVYQRFIDWQIKFWGEIYTYIPILVVSLAIIYYVEIQEDNNFIINLVFSFTIFISTIWWFYTIYMLTKIAELLSRSKKEIVEVINDTIELKKDIKSYSKFIKQQR